MGYFNFNGKTTQEMESPHQCLCIFQKITLIYFMKYYKEFMKIGDTRCDEKVLMKHMKVCLFTQYLI